MQMLLVLFHILVLLNATLAEKLIINRKSPNSSQSDDIDDKDLAENHVIYDEKTGKMMARVTLFNNFPHSERKFYTAPVEKKDDRTQHESYEADHNGRRYDAISSASSSATRYLPLRLKLTPRKINQAQTKYGKYHPNIEIDDNSGSLHVINDNIRPDVHRYGRKQYLFRRPDDYKLANDDVYGNFNDDDDEQANDDERPTIYAKKSSPIYTHNYY